MGSRKKFMPHIMRIDSTVGECGNNKPEEVLWFQQTLSESGYQELTGRDVKVTGKFSGQNSTYKVHSGRSSPDAL